MSRLVIDTLITGLPLVPAVLGIYLVFRLRSDFDLTIDASFTIGATVLSAIVLRDLPAPVALLAATLAGGVMGLITTTLHLALRIPVILAGLIMSIGFYSVALRGLERPTVSLVGVSNILPSAAGFSSDDRADLAQIGVYAAIVVAVLALIGLLLRTQIGLALRAAGVNPRMARSFGVNDRAMLALSLFLANGLAGLSGALVVEGQNFADVNMGAGTLIAGIGAVLLGDLIIRPGGSSVLRVMLAVLIGALVYRFILVSALRIGVPATDLKGVTAIILVLALATERGLRTVLTPLRFRRRSSRSPNPPNPSTPPNPSNPSNPSNPPNPPNPTEETADAGSR
jgi:putative ABC transport system permease protein